MSTETESHEAPMTQIESAMGDVHDATWRKPKVKAPTYTVMRQTEVGDGLWELVGDEIDAPNPREAIRAATDGDYPDPFGTFRVMLSGQVRELERKKKVIPETIADEWE